MLKVKTYLDISTIPNIGIGLFADERIDGGTVIWDFVEGLDFVISNSDLSKLPSLEQDFIKKYG